MAASLVYILGVRVDAIGVTNFVLIIHPCCDCRVPFIITLLLVSICAAQQSRLHEALVDISFLFGEVQVRECA